MLVDLSKEPFYRSLNRIVNDRASALKLRKEDIAHRLGTDYRSLMYWIETDSRHCPARIVPKPCEILDNYELLDALEREVHRVAFSTVHQSEHTTADNINAVQRLVREVGRALGELAKTLDEGIVEIHQLGS